MNLLCPFITKSGWIYSLASPKQGQGYVFGNPMYYPDINGTRIINGNSFSKFYRQIQNVSPWKQPYAFEPSIDPWAAMIPEDEILSTIEITNCFSKWISKSDERAEVVKNIVASSGLLTDCIGITGSVSLGCQTSDSDVDVIIYGTQNLNKCLKVIEELLLRNSIRLMTEKTARGYADRYGRLYSIDGSALFEIFLRDITKIYVNDKKISIIFAYHVDEFVDIPDSIYKNSLLTTKFKAKIVTSTLSWFYPRKYLVQKGDGSFASVWSHHWLYKAMAPIGTFVEICADEINSSTYVLTGLNHHILPTKKT